MIIEFTYHEDMMICMLLKIKTFDKEVKKELKSRSFLKKEAYIAFSYELIFVAVF